MMIMNLIFKTCRDKQVICLSSNSYLSVSLYQLIREREWNKNKTAFIYIVIENKIIYCAQVIADYIKLNYYLIAYN